MRVWLHGRLTMCVESMSWLYHASLDPYNSTEFMDWTWTNLVLDWTNGRWLSDSEIQNGTEYTLITFVRMQYFVEYGMIANFTYLVYKRARVTFLEIINMNHN